ncbi:MAG: hypothetical protein IJF88_04265 [Oscillospiraceae bacterium]|nr:hypothetical protein [Oscillospiraceae bacterium]
MRRFLRKIISLMNVLKFHVLTVVKFPGNLVKIGKLIKQPSYYPELTRKSNFQMWKDHVKWLLRYKEVNYLYTGYGLDIQGFRNPEDFISHRDFCRERDAGVKTKRAFYGKPYNEAVLVRDKYVFSAYIEATVGEDAIPETIGLLDRGEVFLHATKTWIPLQQFCEQDFRYVFKDIDGTFGDGVKLIRNENGKLYYRDAAHSLEEFAAEYGKGRYLIQALIVQHPALQAFRTNCVNTVRAITIRGKKSGKIELFAAFLRVGNDEESFVDNRAKGGLGVGVELETGRLMQYGFPHEKFGTKTTVHPLSGIVFEGYQLPFWKETVELITNAHRQFPDIATIGWDVTMTEQGPLIVEANDGWEISGPQDTYGGLKKRWKELLNA